MCKPSPFSRNIRIMWERSCEKHELMCIFGGWVKLLNHWYKSKCLHRCFVIITLLGGYSKMTSLGNDGRRVPKISDKKWQAIGVYMQIVTSTPKKYVSVFLLVFDRRGSSCTLVSISVGVSFQALTWLRARRLNKTWSSHS